MSFFFDLWSKLIITEGEFADFSEIEDVYNCIMAVVCVVSAGIQFICRVIKLTLSNTKLSNRACRWFNHG